MYLNRITLIGFLGGDAEKKVSNANNIAVFSGPDQVAASGYIWDEYRKQIAYKPFVLFEHPGRGNVIGFTSDPNFRAYLNGLNVLFLNAVFRGPGHADK